MKRIATIFLLILAAFTAGAQTTRKLPAVRATLPIRIDGALNEEAWKQAPPVRDFVEQRPSFGKAEDPETRTEFYILYDDNAVYVGGFCHERARDSIATELLGRDQIGINDFAGVIFDTYLDHINGVGFYVTALGEQCDTKYALNNEDATWSAVYETATKIRNDGWTFEMRIPYSALRFSKQTVQTWGVNFLRRRAKTGRQYLWNPVDPNRFGFVSQFGQWEGIRDIRSPVRLSFSPYFSTYLQHNTDKKWDASVNGGMDLKYGLSKGFTLDMTLVPDFGQVQSDNQVLNLSPFEVRYNENRSFFTEGTELFNKGNLFYSRRIGGTPLHYDLPSNIAGPDDVILKNPSETKLLNATKISGRTSGKLGIGFFNAITQPEYAEIIHPDGGKYKVETSSLTNYNIIVLDQAMKNNSSVTLVNTNVTRSGSDYDANVTAALWDLYDKKVAYNFWGKVANSRLYGFAPPQKNINGYNYELNFGKFRGAFNFEVHQYMADSTYEQNDMGYFTNNNYLKRGGTLWYKWVKPTNIYNNIYLNLSATYTERFRPRAYQSTQVELNASSQLKNLWNVSFYGSISPQEQDFYEPRVAGMVFKRPGSWVTYVYANSNPAKKYSASASIGYRPFQQYGARFVEINAANQYRFSDRLSVGLTNYLMFGHNNPGFAYIDTTHNQVIFGLRRQRTVENILSVKYNFNIRMGLTFRARHYWSKVQNTQFFDLMNSGHLQPIADGDHSADENVNFFNIDMVYTWQFAPGSFINVAWKDAAQSSDADILTTYYHNLDRTLRVPQQNSLSVKVIYYLDYLSLQKKRPLPKL